MSQIFTFRCLDRNATDVGRPYMIAAIQSRRLFSHPLCYTNSTFIALSDRAVVCIYWVVGVRTQYWLKQLGATANGVFMTAEKDHVVLSQITGQLRNFAS